MIRDNFKLNLPLDPIFPKDWGSDNDTFDYLKFRNLDHFRHTVSKISQINDGSCDMSYKKALKGLISGKADYDADAQDQVRNLVRENLHKRGLITEEVYENFKYDVEGTTVGFDVGKYAAGEPDCVITPSRQYVDFFYELYISISYPWNITNEEIRASAAKLLATIEELERRHIFIKVSLVLPIEGVTRDGDTDFFASVPLFSHKDRKSVETMSSVVNDKLLRKFFFAIIEDLYRDDLSSGYGRPREISGCMNIGHEFNEVELFEKIVEETGAGTF